MDFVKASDVKTRKLANGTMSYLLGHTPEMTVVRSVRPAGLDFPPHSHPQAQNYFILSGKMEVTAGDETRIMETGDTWIIDGGVPHGAHTIEVTDELEVFCPGRPDLAAQYQ